MTAVLGLDIGNDRCVVAVARNGIVEVILNEDSLRETPSLVHFSRRHRLFGSSAAAAATSNPTTSISQLKRLIGVPYKDQHFFERERPHLPYTTSEAPDGGIAVNLRYLGKDRAFTAVSLLAMLLSHLRRVAIQAVGGPVSECVIGIPSYFDDKQRRAYLAAAEVAGLRPLRLMQEGAAVALKYGIYKARDDTPTTVVAFVDVGHCGTQATVVCFGCGGLIVLGHASDRNLGGRDFDEVILDHFTAKFKDLHDIDVSSNVKAKVRLWAACEKTKKVLSANKEAEIAVDSLIGGIDVNGMITREEFERLSSGLVTRIGDLLSEALAKAEVDLDRVNSVELVGSGSRIPAISRRLREIYGREISRTLNGSECVAGGCAFECAMLSSMCKVRNYEVQDLFPFSLAFSLDQSFPTGSTARIHNLLIPTTKILTFRLSEFCTTLSMVVDYAPAGSETRKLDVHGTITVKVRIHLNLHGLVTMESAPFGEETHEGKDEYDQAALVDQEKQLLCQDRAYERLQMQRNALEAYIYETRNKILGGRLESFAEDGSAEAIVSARLTEVEDWIYEDREEESEKDYSNRMNELRKFIQPLEEELRKPH